MRSIWIVFVIGLATSEKLLVSSQTFPASDDMYLEGQSSGGFPSDDEDLNFSGSGLSELEIREIQEIMNKTRSLGVMPLTPDGTPDGTPESTISPTMVQADTTQTEVTGLEPSDDPEVADTTDSLSPTTYIDATLPEEKDTVRDFVGDDEWDGIVLEPELSAAENMWQRTEVLAVIACGVVGFLCALFLVLFIAYRMKKKDEGSYALGVAKVPPSAYQKQPPKEFYA